MFGLFGKKKEKSIYDEIKNFAAYQKTSTLIEKANNLMKLGRKDEAAQVFAEAEQLAINSVKSAPDSLQANLLLAFFYKKAQVHDRAEEILENLLKSNHFKLEGQNRLIIEGELQRIKREKPIDQKNIRGSRDNFTQIYSCHHCGRITNYVTMPCPNCQWYPADLLSFARSVVLSTSTMKVPALLLLAREVSEGRPPSEVVVNLDSNAKQYYELPESTSKLRYMFDLLQKNSSKNLRDMNMVRECPNCGERILFSNENDCNSCGKPNGWPDAVKLLACMDNILWLFEQRVEVSNTKEFSEFVCLVVLMTNELLRKQEVPSSKQRQYALSLLSDMKAISDKNNGVVFDTTNPGDIQIYLVKENMLEDSEQFGQFFYAELEFFANKMSNGVNL